MGQRTSYDHAVADLQRLHAAARMAHGEWDPETTDSRLRTIFREFGRFRWVVVPLAVLALALFVAAIAAYAGIATPPGAA